MILRLCTLIFALLNISSISFAQSSTPGGSVRLTVLGGGNVQFIFNTIATYNSGITFNNWTRLGISVRDEIGDINPPVGDDYTTWNLTFRAEDADADGFLTGSVPANTIPFANLQVRATVSAGCGTCNLFASPWLNLSTIPTLLVDGSLGGGWPPDQIRDFPSPDNLTFGTDQINISYRCGVVPLGSMLGRPSDNYSDVIYFDLTMSP